MSTIKEIGPFEVDSFVTEEDILKDASFNPLKIDEEVAAISQRVAYYGLAFGKSVRQTARFKTKLEALEADTAHRLREEAIEAKEKIVEARINSDISRDKKVIAMRLSYAEAKGVEQSLWCAYDSMKSKQRSIAQAGQSHNDDRYSKMGMTDGSNVKERMRG